MTFGLINNPRGMTDKQINSFRALITADSITEFIHCGDRQDEVAHNLIVALGKPIKIIPHFSNKWKYDNAEYLPGMPLSERNRTLVDKSGAIIATPMIIFEDEDSPTWRTINYALNHKEDKLIYIISPKGHIFGVERA